MIDRYSLPEMKRVWSEEEKINKWLLVEIAVLEALSKFGIIPEKNIKMEKLLEKFQVNIDRIKELEKLTKHDLAAFVDYLIETFVKQGKEQLSRWIHYGLTSSDVLDTATAIQLKESSKLLIEKLLQLRNTLKKLSLKYKNTLMIGRTHGIHAEPITFGFKLLGWYSEISRDLELMSLTLEYVSYGKISGAVGTYAHLNPEIEEYVCKKLALKVEPVSTQIIPRDRYAVYLLHLAVIAASIEKFAIELRNLQRTEIQEIEESFTVSQKGSSAMPHKKNPITSEQISGLARVIRANCIAALENVPLWHERDISHSSVERIILPDSSILIDYILHKFNQLLENLTVYPENMKENLKKSRETYFSQPLMLALIRKGASRNQAYRIIQKISHEAISKKINFTKLALKDKYIAKYLTQAQLKKLFNLNHFQRNIDKIYKRIFHTLLQS